MKNRKAVLGASVLISFVAIIAVSSFFPFIIDPHRWMTADFLTKEVIIVVITIAGIVTAMLIGQSKNDADERSEICKARVRFGETSEKVKADIKRFEAWVSQSMSKKDTLEKRRRLMAKFGIEDETLFDLDITEVEELIGKPSETHKSITKEQFKFIRDWKRGKYAIDFVDPSYYVTCSKIRSNLTISEKAGGESRDKALLLGSATASKVIMSLIVGITFASLVYDSAMAEDKAQLATAWMNFTSRMISLITSVFSGFMLGYKVNDVESDYINLRCDVHEKFLADSQFKPQEVNENGYKATDGSGQGAA